MSKLLVTIDGNDFEVEVASTTEQEGFVTVVVNGAPVQVAISSLSTPEAIEWAVVNTTPYELQIDRDLRWIQAAGGRHTLQVRDLEATVSRPVSRDGRIKAPIPGLIARILVEPGQEVAAGQPIIVLEAMKMENEIKAPRTGTIASLNVRPGQTVILNEMLGEIS